MKNLERRQTISTTVMLFFFLTTGMAQETVGLHLSNYLPATSIQLNPALAVDSRSRLDVHLMGAASFIRNNHLFLSRERPGILDLVNGAEARTIENLVPGNRSAYLDISVDGPGFALVKGRSSIALSTRYRMVSHARGVPHDLARFIHQGFDLSTQQDSTFSIENMQAAVSTWGEASITYGRMLWVTPYEHINAAVTVKPLFGLGGAGLHLKNVSYELSNGDLTVNNFSGNYTYATQGRLKPIGWGFDIGMVYKKVIDGKVDYVPFSKESSCAKSKYRYKFGISLLDVGSMIFRQRSATVRYDYGRGDWEDIVDFDPTDLEEVQAELEQQFEGDNNNFEREEITKMSLPTALSVQFGLNLDTGFHIGAVLQQNLKRRNSTNIRRANLLSVVPRYEKKFFEFSMPVSAYEYNKVMMGAAMRLYFLTVGSDDLWAVINRKDLYGADFYFSLRIPIYRTFTCNPNKSRSAKPSEIAPCWGQ